MPASTSPSIVNMALFVGYIVIAHRVSRHDHLAGIDGLAVAMVVAAALAVPIGIVDAAPASPIPSPSVQRSVSASRPR